MSEQSHIISRRDLLKARPRRRGRGGRPGDAVVHSRTGNGRRTRAGCSERRARAAAAREPSRT